MTALCPHCGEPMRKQGVSKLLKATGYWCPGCGQHFTKVKGWKGYYKGQPINLPQSYFTRK